MANSVDPNETAHHEPSHLVLHCLQKYLSWSTGLKRVDCPKEIKKNNFQIIPSDASLSCLARSITNRRGVWLVFIIAMFCKTSRI